MPTIEQHKSGKKPTPEKKKKAKKEAKPQDDGAKADEATAGADTSTEETKNTSENAQNTNTENTTEYHPVAELDFWEHNKNFWKELNRIKKTKEKATYQKDKWHPTDPSWNGVKEVMKEAVSKIAPYYSDFPNLEGIQLTELTTSKAEVPDQENPEAFHTIRGVVYSFTEEKPDGNDHSFKVKQVDNSYEILERNDSAKEVDFSHQKALTIISTLMAGGIRVFNFLECTDQQRAALEKAARDMNVHYIDADGQEVAPPVKKEESKNDGPLKLNPSQKDQKKSRKSEDDSKNQESGPTIETPYEGPSKLNSSQQDQRKAYRAKQTTKNAEQGPTIDVDSNGSAKSRTSVTEDKNKGDGAKNKGPNWDAVAVEAEYEEVPEGEENQTDVTNEAPENNKPLALPAGSGSKPDLPPVKDLLTANKSGITVKAQNPVLPGINTLFKGNNQDIVVGPKLQEAIDNNITQAQANSENTAFNDNVVSATQPPAGPPVAKTTATNSSSGTTPNS